MWTGAKEYKCDSCRKKFTHKKQLLNHLKTFHQILKGTHKCLTCNKAFPNSSSLSKHRWNEHQCEKKYECGFCGTKFLRSKQLNVHIFYKHNEGRVGFATLKKSNRYQYFPKNVIPITTFPKKVITRPVRVPYQF